VDNNILPECGDSALLPDDKSPAARALRYVAPRRPQSKEYSQWSPEDFYCRKLFYCSQNARDCYAC